MITKHMTMMDIVSDIKGQHIKDIIKDKDFLPSVLHSNHYIYDDAYYDQGIKSEQLLFSKTG